MSKLKIIDGGAEGENLMPIIVGLFLFGAVVILLKGKKRGPGNLKLVSNQSPSDGGSPSDGDKKPANTIDRILGDLR